MRKLTVEDVRRGVSEEAWAGAEKAAAESAKGEYPWGFTESHPELVIIYNDARTGQFDASALKRMPREWLVYLDGHQVPDRALFADDPEDLKRLTREKRGEVWSQGSKLQANARRANLELQRRHGVRLALLGAAVALLAAVLAAVLSAGIGARVAVDNSAPGSTTSTTTTP